MIDATATAPPLDLTNYALRAVSLTEQECDLISRLMAIALTECSKSAGKVDASAMEALSANWLRDEVKRIGDKFLPANVT